ncbi:MAG: 3-dehydro-L-gulonate 2-dehydrogenase [Ginsengibacter sp.]
MNNTVLIQSDEMQNVFQQILLKHEFAESKAKKIAEIFTVNTIEGVYTHGVYRFPRFMQYIKDKLVKKDADPSFISGFGGMEQWNGNLGPGPLNAIYATERAMQLSQQNGIGCVALANTNHWMRGGYYGWLAAKKGFVFIGWTNTLGIMPAWKALDSRLGNNPLVIGLPFNDEAIVLDMAFSQFSYGAMELAAMKKEELPVPGGFDKEGRLTKNPTAILESRRPMSIGYWKGAGISLLLDVLASVLSAGFSVAQISKQEAEISLSQVFICIDLTKLSNYSSIPDILKNIIDDYKQSAPVGSAKIVYPGEGVVQKRKKNLQDGIPVLKEKWEEILQL